MQNRMEQNKDRLLPLYSTCFEKFSNATITEVYTLLFDKMVNLRKKEMERSWERLDTRKNATLNLRDELKPFAVKLK
jgi:lysine/ornithine N-monooxygenase